MKTIKITTHWTAEQAEEIYRLLDELKWAIWQNYGEDIAAMHRKATTEQEQEQEKKDNNEFNDELPF